MDRIPSCSRAGRILLAGWPAGAVGIGLIGCGSAWVAILVYHFGIAAGIILCGREGRTRLRWSGPSAWDWAGLPFGFGTFLAVRTCLPTLLAEESPALWSGFPERLAEVGLTGAWLWLFVIYFVTVHPIAEEMAWRGVLGNASPRLRWEDGAFAAYHLLVLGHLFPGAWALWFASLGVLVAAAWFWRQLVRATGGLRTVIFHHASADAGILTAILWGAT